MATEQPSAFERFKENVELSKRAVGVICAARESMNETTARSAELVAESRELLANMNNQFAGR